MKIVITHPHGNQNTSRTVSILNKTKMLDTFWTTFALPQKFNFLKKKNYNVDFNKIKIRFLKEILRRLCILFKLNKLYLNDKSIFSVYSIYQDLDLKVSKYLIQNKNKKK